jgi:hypothetical protein
MKKRIVPTKLADQIEESKRSPMRKIPPAIGISIALGQIAMNETPLDRARSAKPKAIEAFGRLADVVGVGITRVGSGYALKVNLRFAPSPATVLPTEIEGVPVRIEIVGEARRI